MAKEKVDYVPKEQYDKIYLELEASKVDFQRLNAEALKVAEKYATAQKQMENIVGSFKHIYEYTRAISDDVRNGKDLEAGYKFNDMQKAIVNYVQQINDILAKMKQ